MNRFADDMASTNASRILCHKLAFLFFVIRIRNLVYHAHLETSLYIYQIGAQIHEHVLIKASLIEFRDWAIAKISVLMLTYLHA